MATKTLSLTNTDFVGENNRNAAWLAMANGDDGDPMRLGGLSDRSVQISGTFGTGGTVVIEGSNDGTNWQTLRDPQGVALSFTAAGLKAVLELTAYIRPRVTAGDGTTSLNVNLFAKG